MYKRQPYKLPGGNRVFARKAAMNFGWDFAPDLRAGGIWKPVKVICRNGPCLLYTSDAADERSSVDLGGRRIIKKKTKKNIHVQ